MSPHAADKAFIRYNMNLTGEDLKKIVQKIQSGESMHLLRIGKYKSFHMVEYNKIPLKVLYTSRGKWIITIYPFDEKAANDFIELKKIQYYNKIVDAIKLLEHEGYTVLIGYKRGNKYDQFRTNSHA